MSLQDVAEAHQERLARAKVGREKKQKEEMDKLSPPTGSRFGWDSDKNPVLLFPSDWAASYFEQNSDGLALAKVPPNQKEL